MWLAWARSPRGPFCFSFCAPPPPPAPEFPEMHGAGTWGAAGHMGIQRVCLVAGSEGSGRGVLAAFVHVEIVSPSGGLHAGLNNELRVLQQQ